MHAYNLIDFILHFIFMTVSIDTPLFLLPLPFPCPLHSGRCRTRHLPRRCPQHAQALGGGTGHRRQSHSAEPGATTACTLL